MNAYFIQNISHHLNLKLDGIKIISDPKKDIILEFEDYMRSNGVIILDYHRMIHDKNYYDMCMHLYRVCPQYANKPVILYSSYNNSYMGETNSIHSWDIVKRDHFSVLKKYLLAENIALPNCHPKRKRRYLCVNCGYVHCTDCFDSKLTFFWTTWKRIITCQNCNFPRWV